MEKVLLVEDDVREQRAIARFLTGRGHEVLTAVDARSAEAHFVQLPDVIVTDLRLASGDGMRVLREARQVLPETPVILVTGHATVASAVEAMKQGAFDYLTKPINPEELLLAIQRGAERSQLQREVRRLRCQVAERGGFFGMIGNSEPMRRVCEQIQLVAPTRSTGLITGESGTGKELVAHAIHQLSSRKGGPFVALNCAAIPHELAESELFGHAKGAFTGATERRIGKFAAAHQGTLLIDEIGEMALPVQAKLLRCLETHTITLVGANEEQVVDVRVVAATHRDLRALVDAGKFREDLYYRLHVVRIELPPLRERSEDIPLLVSAFLRQLNEEHDRGAREVSAEVLGTLRGYRWPGNVRELRNALEGAVVLSRKDMIELADLPPDVQGARPGAQPAPRVGTSLAELERGAIQQCLLETRGSRKCTAETLGISTRTLLRKIREYRMEDPLESLARTAAAGEQAPQRPVAVSGSKEIAKQ